MKSTYLVKSHENPMNSSSLFHTHRSHIFTYTQTECAELSQINSDCKKTPSPEHSDVPKPLKDRIKWMGKSNIKKRFNISSISGKRFSMRKPKQTSDSF